IDGPFPRRLPAHRRDDPGGAVAGRAHHRSGRDALQAPAQGHAAQADGTCVERKAGLSAHTSGTVVSATQATIATAGTRPIWSPKRQNRKGPVAPATEPPV